MGKIKMYICTIIEHKAKEFRYFPVWKRRRRYTMRERENRTVAS